MKLDQTGSSIAYILWDYPVASETFIAREIEQLRQAGIDVTVLAIRRSTPTRPALGYTQNSQKPTHTFRGASAPLSWLTVGLFAKSNPKRALHVARSAIAAATRINGCASGASVQPNAPNRIVNHTVRMVRTSRLAFSACYWAFVALYFARYLQARQPTQLHAHFASVPAKVAAATALALEIPWGVSVHARDLYANQNAADTISSARYIIACSEVARRDLVRRLPIGRAVRCVPHGLDIDFWTKDSSISSVFPPTILAVGRLVPKKGFDILLRACATLRGADLRFQCTIVGTGFEEFRLRELISALSLEKCVRLCPWQSPLELRARYRTAAVLAVPSLVMANGDRDNIPNVLVEALSCSLPTVVSALPALKHLLEVPRAALLVKPGCVDSLATGLQEVICNAALAAAIAESGRRLVEEHYDQRTTTPKLLEAMGISAPKPRLRP